MTINRMSRINKNTLKHHIGMNKSFINDLEGGKVDLEEELKAELLNERTRIQLKLNDGAILELAEIVMRGYDDRR